MTAVANLHGVEVIEGRAFLVWDYVEGRTIEEILATLGDDTRDRLKRDVRLMVEQLHGQGIVHGALHGRNMIVDERGGVRITHVSPLLHSDERVDFAALERLFGEPAGESATHEAMESRWHSDAGGGRRRAGDCHWGGGGGFDSLVRLGSAMSLVTRYLDPALLERLSALQLSARRVVEGATLGQHRSPVRGASIEFRQHRAYVAGDEPRRLDWRVLARTDRPYVREYHQETNLRAMLLLDRSGSMGYRSGGAGKSEIRNPKSETKFEYAGKVVASLAYLMLHQGESVGMATLGAGIEQWLTPHAGTGQLSRVIGTLERTAANGAADVPRAMNQAADRVGRRALMVVVSDLFCEVTALRAALSRLRHAGHEVIVLRVLDEDEVTFPLKGWVRLRGLEGERMRMCEPSIVRQRYLEAFEAHDRRVAQRLPGVRCGNAHVYDVAGRGRFAGGIFEASE